MLLREVFAASTLPVVGSDVAQKWDSIYHFLVGLSAFFFVLVIGAMIVFSIKYRASVHKKSKYITDHHALEIFWTAVPTVILLALFGWGWQVYRAMISAPADAMEIKVIGKQWLWQFQYDDGRVTINDLYVPVNKPVKLMMTSDDVLHSMFIPAFRAKRDIVPNVYSSVWFEPSVEGRHHIFCAEYCGTSHSGMIGTVHVLNAKDWALFKAGKYEMASGSSQTAANEPPVSLVEQGKKLTQSKGCIACHSADGNRMVGPSYKGVFGADRELHDGSVVKADENYLRESILNPQAKIVKGFGPPSAMPVFQGLLSEQEMNSLIEYIKSVK